jgi:hypothetical protein
MTEQCGRHRQQPARYGWRQRLTLTLAAVAMIAGFVVLISGVIRGAT